VYEAEKVNVEVKDEVADPTKYLMLDAPLTRSKRKAVEQLDDPHRRHRRALSITEALRTSPSVSKKTHVTPQLATSGPTWTRPIHS
jgi:ferric-dicitrate binding protein FerR (iron transport regulator)